MADAEPSELRTYLRRLGWGLATMSKPDREGIVEETRAHVLDRLDQGATIAAALAALGPADRYARRFLDEAEIVSALASQRPLTVLGAVVRRIHRSAAAGLAFALVLTLFTVAGLGVITCVMKLFDPQHVGLWVAPGEFFFGRPDHAGKRHEILGYWLFPLTVVAMASAWMLARLILLWALRREGPRD